MEAKAVAEMLRYEHPQIISIVLSYLDSDQAAEVLTHLPENMRADILMRVATLDGVHPTALNELDEVLEKQFSGNSATKTTGGFGGPKAAAEILNLVGTAQEGTIMRQIAKIDEPLSQKLQDLMFVFEDLVEVDDRGMQELLREVPGDKLIIALKAADETLKQKFFKNMSERAATDAEGRPGGQGPGAAVGSRGGAEGDPGDRAAHGRRRPAVRSAARAARPMSEAAHAAVWELPQIDGPVVARRRRAADLDADRARSLGARAMPTGARPGSRPRSRSSRRRWPRSSGACSRLGAIFEFMARPLAELDEQVQRQLGDARGRDRAAGGAPRAQAAARRDRRR